MDAIAAVMNSGPAVKAGLEFVWIISFGQLVTIGVTVATILFGLGKIVATVWGLSREVKELKTDVRELRTGISELMGILVNAKLRELEKVNDE